MKKFICHPVRLIFIACCFLILFTLVVVYLIMGNYVAAVVFGILMAVYGYCNVGALCSVGVDDTCVTKYVLGIKGFSYDWSEIREVGVIYTNHTRRYARSKRPAQCSIYFSPRKMTSEERLKVCLDWPPKDIIELAYGPERMREITRHLDKKWIFFNITSDELFGDEAILFDFNAEEIRY